jgi:hypothetical protein
VLSGINPCDRVRCIPRLVDRNTASIVGRPADIEMEMVLAPFRAGVVAKIRNSRDNFASRRVDEIIFDEFVRFESVRVEVDLLRAVSDDFSIRIDSAGGILFSLPRKHVGTIISHSFWKTFEVRLSKSNWRMKPEQAQHDSKTSAGHLDQITDRPLRRRL